MIGAQPPPLSRNSSSPSTDPPHLQPLQGTQLHRNNSNTALHSRKTVLTIRWTILALSLCCLILDIIAINFYFTHHFPFSVDHLIVPSGAYAVFMLLPDTVVSAMMSMLLWKRIRLPDRMWTIHTVCRIFFSLVIVAFALICPIYQLCYFASHENGWAGYLCQFDHLPTWSGDNASSGGGGGNTNISFVWQLQQQPRPQSAEQGLLNSCRMMRARSIITFVWSLLVFVELLVAYRVGEFQRREWSRNVVWTAQGSELNKRTCYSSSEIWDDGEGGNTSHHHVRT